MRRPPATSPSAASPSSVSAVAALPIWEFPKMGDPRVPLKGSFTGFLKGIYKGSIKGQGLGSFRTWGTLI